VGLKKKPLGLNDTPPKSWRKGGGLGPKIGRIRPYKSNTEEKKKRGGAGLKIGLIRPKRHTTEVMEEEGKMGLIKGPVRP
jgi:hypothetical protein